MLLKNYIIFTLALVIMVTGILVYGFLRLAYRLDEVSPQQLLDYSDELAEASYDDINFVRLLGRGGYAAVLDAELRPEYLSDTSKIMPSLTKKELVFVPNYLDPTWPEVVNIVDDSGKAVTRITVYKNTSDGQLVVANQFFLDT